MQLILVRHAQPVIERTDGAPADPGLSELGRWQAAQLAEWLRHEPIDQVITSPKRRAVDTVRDLIDGLDVPHTVVDDLDEIDRRSTVYLPTELLAEQGGEYWEAILRQDYESAGWDHPDHFRERVLAAFTSIVEAKPGARVLVACHGGTIGTICASVLGLEGQRSFGLEYASISRVDAGGERLRLLSLNETAHFDGVRSGVVGPLRDGGVGQSALPR